MPGLLGKTVGRMLGGAEEMYYTGVIPGVRPIASVASQWQGPQ
jgi:hypothetical protein